jgi:RNA polymerase-binding transcription factor DksA
MEATRALELLDAERIRLRAVLDGIDVPDHDESAGQHQADVGTETFERERALTLRRDVEIELAEVADAVMRVERGRYGICEDCGRPVPDERLEALPATRWCVTHVEAHELLGDTGPLTRERHDFGFLPDDETEPRGQRASEEAALHEQ